MDASDEGKGRGGEGEAGRTYHRKHDPAHLERVRDVRDAHVHVVQTDVCAHWKLGSLQGRHRKVPRDGAGPPMVVEPSHLLRESASHGVEA